MNLSKSIFSAFSLPLYFSFSCLEMDGEQGWIEPVTRIKITVPSLVIPYRTSPNVSACKYCLYECAVSNDSMSVQSSSTKWRVPD